MDVPVETVAEYAAEDADVTLQLRSVLQPLAREKGAERALAECETPLIPVLVDMEMQGIRIDTGILSGSGSIYAIGGSNTSGNSGGGSGGRIAVYYDDISGFNAGRIHAYGGDGYGGYDGGAGTIYLKGSGQAHGNLTVDNANRISSGWSTPQKEKRNCWL